MCNDRETASAAVNGFAVAPESPKPEPRNPFLPEINGLAEIRSRLIGEVNQLNVEVSRLRAKRGEMGYEWRRAYEAFRIAEDALSDIDSAIRRLDQAGLRLAHTLQERQV